MHISKNNINKYKQVNSHGVYIKVGYTLKKEHKVLVIPFLLSFFMVSSALSGSTYAISLFLSTYPREWLTYLYLVNPLAMMVIYFLAAPLLAKATSKQSSFIIFGTTALLVITYSFLFSKIYIIPFILTILFNIISTVIMAICWNAIATTFDILEFKKHVFKINTLGSAGAMITAFLSPVIIYFFQLPGLFIFTILINILIGTSLLFLNQPPPVQSKKTRPLQTALHKQSFFIFLFLLMIISLLIDVLVDFGFNLTLMENYSKEDIAMFISVFKGVLSISVMVIQLFVAQRLIALIGLSGMLFIMPFILLIVAGSLFVWPVFFIFIALKGSYSLLNNTFNNPAMEMVINPYPSALRKKASFYLKGYAIPIGSLLAVPFIYAVTHYIPPAYLGLIIFLFSIVWLLVLFQVKKGYTKILHNSLKERRYSSELVSRSPEIVMLMEQENLKALESEDIDIAGTALSFFSQAHKVSSVDPGKLISIIIPMLNNPDDGIRYNASLALGKFNACEAYTELLNQLKKETTPFVGWELVHTICAIRVDDNDIDYNFWLTSKQSYQIGYGIIMLDRSLNPSVKNKAAKIINMMLEGSLEDRMIIARIERFLNHTPQQTKRLSKLIHDDINKVSTLAIQSVSQNSDIELIPQLFELLTSKKRSYYAQKALAKFGDRALDKLLLVEISAPSFQLRAAVNILARTLNAKSLEKLITLSQSYKVSIRLYIAKSLRQFIQYNQINTLMREQIVRMVVWEAMTIQQLLQLEIQKNNSELNREVTVQLRINREVYIIWLSLLLGSGPVSSVEHYIINPEQSDKTDIAKAYEFLDALSTNVSLKRSIAIISKNYDRNQPIKPSSSINPGIILLAEHTTTSLKVTSMNLIEKAIFLRKVELFKDVPFDSLEVIAEVAHVRDMAAKEYLFKDGDAPDCFYCVVSGQVEIKKLENSFAKLNQTDYFGELGLLDGSPRTADAIATKDGILLYINMDEFVRLLEDIPNVMHAVLKQVLKYLRANIDMVQELASSRKNQDIQ